MSVEINPGTLTYKLLGLFPVGSLRPIGLEDLGGQQGRAFEEIATGDQIILAAHEGGSGAGVALARGQGRSSSMISLDWVSGRSGHCVFRKFGFGEDTGQLMEARVPHRTLRGARGYQFTFLNCHPDLRGTLGMRRIDILPDGQLHNAPFVRGFASRLTLARDGRSVIWKKWMGHRWDLVGRFLLPPHLRWVGRGKIDLVQTLLRGGEIFRFVAARPGISLLDWGIKRLLEGPQPVVVSKTLLNGAALLCRKAA